MSQTIDLNENRIEFKNVPGLPRSVWVDPFAFVGEMSRRNLSGTITREDLIGVVREVSGEGESLSESASYVIGRHILSILDRSGNG